MHTARTVLCCAVLGLAGLAGADDTPYKHEYLNGGYFKEEPDVAQTPSSDPAAVLRDTKAAPYRHSHRNGDDSGDESVAPGAPLKAAHTRE